MSFNSLIFFNRISSYLFKMFILRPVCEMLRPFQFNLVCYYQIGKAKARHSIWKTFWGLLLENNRWVAIRCPPPSPPKTMLDMEFFFKLKTKFSINILKKYIPPYYAFKPEHNFTFLSREKKFSNKIWTIRLFSLIEEI